MDRARYLIFCIDNEYFGVLHSEVLEVGRIEYRSRVPFSPSPVTEVFNHHGKIVPLMNLSVLLGLSDRVREQFILINGDRYPVSFSIDSVVGIEESNEIIDGDVPGFVRFAIKVFNRRVYIIDTKKILEEIDKKFKEV